MAAHPTWPLSAVSPSHPQLAHLRGIFPSNAPPTWSSKAFSAISSTAAKYSASRSLPSTSCTEGNSGGAQRAVGGVRWALLGMARQAQRPVPAWRERGASADAVGRQRRACMHACRQAKATMKPIREYRPAGARALQPPTLLALMVAGMPTCALSCSTASIRRITWGARQPVGSRQLETGHSTDTSGGCPTACSAG